ncbi:SANT/Myb_domain [Hexamita inflata]|uniref:SANT/Myb_domain n=1 Tax=Hexamita inflata TaxID=28002 RepID=A0ABP1GGH4_9EUKA
MKNLGNNYLISDFIQVSFPVLQSINYQFTGLNNEVTDFYKIYQNIQNLSVTQADIFWNSMSHIYQLSINQIKEIYKQIVDSNVQKRQKLIPEKVIQTSYLLRSVLINSLKYFRQEVRDSWTDSEICAKVNSFIEKDIHQRFWNKVASMIPAKTKKQIYDFYHNQFSRSMYSNVTKEEQEMISQLNAEYPNEKPSAVAQIFLERTQKNILKRDIIMRLVNLRRYSKQSETERLQ